jgi:pseudaminic acid cytidylyltransferase
MTSKTKPIAIIPARGGSKRIPRKNIRLFAGMPIIAHSIINAQKTKLFDKIFVSTDDPEIAKIAIEFGAEVPFFRSQETSNDRSGIAEVIIEALGKLRDIGFEPDSFCCLLATAPFIQTQDIFEAYKVLEKGAWDSVVPVVRFSYPIWRSFERKGDHIKMWWPENYPKHSQELPPAFHDCGQFYWLRTEPFLRTQQFFTENTGSIELPESRVQDIDTEEDWAIGEFKWKWLENQKS